MTTTSVERATGHFAPLKADGKPCRLKMQSLWLTGELLPVGARLVVHHEFVSDERRAGELIYAFPLAADAALRRFRIAGPRGIARSELRPVLEAREAYEKGLEEGHLAAHARVHGDGLVNLAVGNIKHGERVTVRLELLAGVEARDDGFRFRFPFSLPPLYHAQARPSIDEDGRGELELPAEIFDDLVMPRWSEDARGLHQVRFNLAVRLGAPLAEVSSPSHPLRVALRGEAEARLTLATEADLPDRDLVIDARAREARPFMLGGIDGEGRARVAAVVPSSQFGAAAQGLKQVVFLLDRSGSMMGAPFDQAQRALLAALGALGEQDRFGIVLFDDTTISFCNALRPADAAARSEARAFLEKAGVCGGTELEAGIEAAGRVLGREGGDIMLLTDGQVMEGESIIRRAQALGARVHALGIGSAARDRFLELLARRTGGTSRCVGPRERVDMAALEVFGRLGGAIACDLRWSIEGSDGSEFEPAPTSHVFDRAPARAWASATQADKLRLVAKWPAAEGERRLEIESTIEPGALGETLRLLAGSRLIADAEVDATGREGDERLLALSRRFGLASRAASLVAVVENPADQPGDPPRTHVVPVGLPQDVEMGGYFSGFMCSPCIAYNLHGTADGADAPTMALHRQRRRFFDDTPLREFDAPLPAAAKEPTPDDVLVDLAGRLEPDGGLPGDSDEARAMSTAIALLAFAEQGVFSDHAAFGRHVVLMLKFLAAANVDEELREVLRDVERRVNGRQGAGGGWIERARKTIIKGKAIGSRQWRKIVKALAG